MRDINRIEPFLQKFGEVWKKNPDLRFGQMVYVLTEYLDAIDMFHPEEDDWLAAIERMKEVK